MSSQNEEERIVRSISAMMLGKLRSNSHKPHWRTIGPDKLFSLMAREVKELQEALSANHARIADIAMECADVANLAAMIADVVIATDSSEPRDISEVESENQQLRNELEEERARCVSYENNELEILRKEVEALRAMRTEGVVERAQEIVDHICRSIDRDLPPGNLPVRAWRARIETALRDARMSGAEEKRREMTEDADPLET